MIILHHIESIQFTDVSWRYAAAIMIEARIRGYPLLTITPKDMAQTGAFHEYINRLIDWLVANYPNEFQRGK